MNKRQQKYQDTPPLFRGYAGLLAVKRGKAQALKGGVIMDVTSVAQARAAEEAGACAVVVMSHFPSDVLSLGIVQTFANCCPDFQRP